MKLYYEKKELNQLQQTNKEIDKLKTELKTILNLWKEGMKSNKVFADVIAIIVIVIVLVSHSMQSFWYNNSVAAFNLSIARVKIWNLSKLKISNLILFKIIIIIKKQE